MARLIISLKNGNTIVESYVDRTIAERALKKLTEDIQGGKQDVVMTPSGASTFRVSEFSSATVIDR